jgi:hypothetical protein
MPNLALHTTQVPPVSSPHQEVIAIIDLTQKRALELLDLMNQITLQASVSSTIFRISSFEPNALFVPAYALATLPPAGDFVVLPTDYAVSAITPIKLVHTNVMPLYASWTATDENDRFLINTAELDGEVLKAIASGYELPPGSTSHSIKNATRPSENNIITREENYLH